MEQKKPKILVVGSINVDLVVPLERMPVGGETVLTDSYSYIPGGKGANQAVAAARLGAEVTFCGCVGDDANGHEMIANFKNESIDTSMIRAVSGTPTGLAVIPVESNGQNRIVVIPGANYKIDKDDIDKAFSQSYDAVIMQLEIPLEIMFYAFSKAKEKGISVILDAGPAMQLPLERLDGIDIISPNESEIEALTGISPSTEEKALEAAEKLSELCNAKAVVVKLGARGALLLQEGKHEIFPTFSEIKPVDTTAAGDSFTAGMAVRLTLGKPVSDSIKYAHAVGSITVSRKGAQPSLPTAAEVDEFLAKYGEK